ncbi:MAG TPA: BON domain-containing protein [Pyrinomonadaceae bacterium]|nr:BON domain-containing protein [Pyrinomonadaceae bacterium]
MTRPGRELHQNIQGGKGMGNYYNRYDDDRYRQRSRQEYYDRSRGVGYSGGDESDTYDRGRGRGVGYRGMDEDDRYWESRPSYYERSRDYPRESRYADEYDERPFNRSLSRGASSYGSAYGAEPATTNRYYERTYRPPYYGRDFESERDARRYNAEARGWWDRASDEVASWFGDEDAERRRRLDGAREANHRGRGPKDYRRSDERIRDDINDRLTDNEYLDAYEVVVAVNEGDVVLTGNVGTRHDKRMAEDIAESVSGVKNVQNQLRIGDTTRTEETTVVTAPQARAAKQL